MAEPAADPNPNANPNPNPNPNPTYNIAESAPMLTHLLTRRDSDLAGLLNSISTVINGIEKLANAQTLDKLATIIDGAATLLGGDEPEKLVNVVNNAQALLTPRFVNETAVIIDDVFPV